MAEIVNLRQARKSKQRREKEKLAEENRIRFGRGKPERQRDLLEREAAARALDGHKREP